jgi:hypothetical protein
VSDVANHEASHAAAALLTGARVARVDLHKTAAVSGTAYIIGNARQHAISALAVILTENGTPSWPLNPARTDDHGDLARLFADMGWNETRYHSLIHETQALIDSDTFKSLRNELAQELRRRLVLTPDEINRIKDTVMPNDTDNTVHRILTEVGTTTHLPNEVTGQDGRPRKSNPDDHAMHKSIAAAFAKVDRMRRLDTEHVEIRSFEC